SAILGRVLASQRGADLSWRAGADAGADRGRAELAQAVSDRDVLERSGRRRLLLLVRRMAGACGEIDVSPAGVLQFQMFKSPVDGRYAGGGHARGLYG